MLAAKAGVGGGSLARVALGAFMKAATELREHGTFNYAEQAIPMPQINGMFLQYGADK